MGTLSTPLWEFRALPRGLEEATEHLNLLSTPLWEFPILALFKNLLSLSIKVFMNIVRTIAGPSHSQAMSILMRKS